MERLKRVAQAAEVPIHYSRFYSSIFTHERANVFEVPCPLSTVARTLHPNLSVAWHDATHMAVVKAAGIDSYYLAVGPDMAKEKVVEVEENMGSGKYGVRLALWTFY